MLPPVFPVADLASVVITFSGDLILIMRMEIRFAVNSQADWQEDVLPYL